MIWKILLGLGLTGLLLGVILIAFTARTFYGSSDPDIEEIAFGGMIISVLLVIISFLTAAVSLIFVLKNSKKAWEANNAK